MSWAGCFLEISTKKIETTCLPLFQSINSCSIVSPLPSKDNLLYHVSIKISRVVWAWAPYGAVRYQHTNPYCFLSHGDFVRTFWAKLNLYKPKRSLGDSWKVDIYTNCVNLKLINKDNFRNIGKGSMDKVDNNDNNTLDDWDLHPPTKRIKVGNQSAKGTNLTLEPAWSWHQSVHGTSLVTAPVWSWYQSDHGTSLIMVPAWLWQQSDNETSLVTAPAWSWNQPDHGISLIMEPSLVKAPVWSWNEHSCGSSWEVRKGKTNY